MVTILAFVVLGGGVAYAAGQLGKKSVGTKQLRISAVTTALIKNEATSPRKRSKTARSLEPSSPMPQSEARSCSRTRSRAQAFKLVL